MALIGEQQTLVDICGMDIIAFDLVHKSEAVLHVYSQDRPPKKTKSITQMRLRSQPYRFSSFCSYVAKLRGWEGDKGKGGGGGGGKKVFVVTYSVVLA